MHACCWRAAKTFVHRKTATSDMVSAENDPGTGHRDPALRKLPHKACQFKAYLGYKIRFCFNETKQTKTQTCKHFPHLIPWLQRVAQGTGTGGSYTECSHSSLSKSPYFPVPGLPHLYMGPPLF